MSNSAELDILVKIIDEKQGENIVSYELKNSPLTECVLIVSGKNITHCRALIEHIQKEVKKADFNPDFYFTPPQRTGEIESGWIILDLNSIIVHVLSEESRSYYQLDHIFEERGTAFHH